METQKECKQNIAFVNILQFLIKEKIIYNCFSKYMKRFENISKKIV